MMDRADVVSFLCESVTKILEDNGNGPRSQITEDTQLFGREGVLASLMLVELMLTVEDYCTEQGRVFAWTDDAAMSERRSAYRSIGSLADAILALPDATGSAHE